MKKQFEQFAQMIPQFKPNANGYELRTKVLEMAQTQTWQDFHAKCGQFETSVKKEGDEIVTSVTMPEVPGVDAVLETANKFYEFVSGNKTKNNEK